MGPTWGRQDPGGPHVDPMNLAIWVIHWLFMTPNSIEEHVDLKWVQVMACVLFVAYAVVISFESQDYDLNLKKKNIWNYRI